MTSAFDVQTNCLSEPERELVWTFLLISLDPLVPGMLKAVYDLAWAPLGTFGELREKAFRGSFALINLQIADVDFVVSSVPAWFTAWAASVSDGDSDPFGSCPSDGF